MKINSISHFALKTGFKIKMPIYISVRMDTSVTKKKLLGSKFFERKSKRPGMIRRQTARAEALALKTV